MATCESGCAAPVYRYDSEGVPVCRDCWNGLLEEWMALSPEEKAAELAEAAHGEDGDRDRS
jgi:hypothetical protein